MCEGKRDELVAYKHISYSSTSMPLKTITQNYFDTKISIEISPFASFGLNNCITEFMHTMLDAEIYGMPLMSIISSDLVQCYNPSHIHPFSICLWIQIDLRTPF